MVVKVNKLKSPVHRFIRTDRADREWADLSIYYRIFISNLLIVELLLKRLNGQVNTRQAELARFLLFDGQNVDLRTMQAGRELLLAAMVYGDIKESRLAVMLANGCLKQSPRATQDAYIFDDRLNALHLAVHRGCIRVVEELISMGADLNQPISGIRTMYPLDIALENGDKEMVQLLAWNGATTTKDLSLHHCVQLRSIEKATLLLDTGLAQIDDRNTDGLTALQLAVKQGKLNMAKLCIDYNADVNVRDKDGLGCLFYAIKNDDQEMVQLLLENGAMIWEETIPRNGSAKLLDTAIGWMLRQDEDVINEIVERL